MKIYKICGGENTYKYVSFNVDSEELKIIQENVNKNKCNFLDKSIIEIKISDKSGIEYPDIISMPIPMISSKLKNIFDENGVDNIFYKPIYLIDDLLEEKFLYWIAVIPKIEVFLEDSEEYIEEEIGNYLIFRDVNQSYYNIYITEKLYEILNRHDLIGINLYEIKN